MRDHMASAAYGSFHTASIDNGRFVIYTVDNGLYLQVTHTGMDIGDVMRREGKFKANRRFVDNDEHTRTFDKLELALRWIWAGYRSELNREFSALANRDAEVFLRE